MASTRRCSSCQRQKSWDTKHKTCPACRAKSARSQRVRQAGGADKSHQRFRAMEKDFSAEQARNVVEYAEKGLRDEQLAMVLRITPEVFKQWRTRGSRSADEADPFFILYFDVNAARAKRFAEKMLQLRDSSNPRSQIAWLEWAFPDARPAMKKANQMPPKMPDVPPKVEPVPVEFV